MHPRLVRAVCSGLPFAVPSNVPVFKGPTATHCAWASSGLEICWARNPPANDMIKKPAMMSVIRIFRCIFNPPYLLFTLVRPAGALIALARDIAAAAVGAGLYPARGADTHTCRFGLSWRAADGGTAAHAPSDGTSTVCSKGNEGRAALDFTLGRGAVDGTRVHIGVIGIRR